MADKITEFFASLYFATIDNSIQWDKTVDDDTFQTSFDNYSVKLILWYDPPDTTEYSISIVDTEGKEIARIGPEDIPNNVTFKGKSPYAAFREMYEVARRTALGIEKALDDILQSLAKLKKPDDDIPF